MGLCCGSVKAANGTKACNMRAPGPAIFGFLRVFGDDHYGDRPSFSEFSIVHRFDTWT
ncbi:unnamed protein product [Penicillium nalgiovense]|nr:unnamed protein product [Penicillium nalgiovense]